MKIRINYAAANAAAASLYRDIVKESPWMKSRAAYNWCLREAFRFFRAAAVADAAPCASEAWNAMTEDSKLDYLRRSAADMPRRAQAHTVWRDGIEVPAPSSIAYWMGEREPWKESVDMVAAEAYIVLLERYLPRADEEGRKLSWAVSRAVWQACSKLSAFYRPGGRSKYKTEGIDSDARMMAPRPAAPDSAALDRCMIEDITGEPGAAAAVIAALDTIPNNATQSAVARHIAAAAGESTNTAIFAAIAAGVEQKYIADALDMTQQAVSYRLRKMRAAADTAADNARVEQMANELDAAVFRAAGMQFKRRSVTDNNAAAPALANAAAPADMFRNSLPAPEAPEAAAQRRRRAAAIAAQNAHARSVTAARAVAAAPDAAARKEARAVARAAAEEAERAAAIAREVAKAAR